MKNSKMDKAMIKKRKKIKGNIRLTAAFVICVAVVFAVFRFDLFSKINGNKPNKTVSTNTNVNANANTEENNSNQSEDDSSSNIENSNDVNVSCEETSAEQVSISEAKKPLWVSVDIATQRTYVYDANNKIVKKFICSTGVDSDPTITGTFHVQLSGRVFESTKYQEGGYYYVQFQGNYLFHSVPFDTKTKKIIEEEAKKLGTKASHGCVRLALADSLWMFKNIIKGTKVVIK